uniref:Cytochrome b5 type B n=1 Tax=Equus asinus TaxID=9793 RepID=A0A9L0I636_EQUAS
VLGPMAAVDASGSDGKGQGVETSVTYYRLEEVAKRNSSKEIWLVIHGRVYDVTRFLNEDPSKNNTCKSCWIYWIFPIVGAILLGFLYRYYTSESRSS